MRIIKTDALNSQTKYVAVCKLISPIIDALMLRHLYAGMAGIDTC